MEQKIKHKFFMLLCKKMKNKGISKIEFWPIWPLSSAIDWVLSNRLGAQQILRLNKMQHINAGYMCFNKKSNLNSEKVDFF